MGATLLAFSYNVLVGIELIGGAPLPLQQQEDYLALWRYIGWLLGVDSKALDPCRNPVRASATPIVALASVPAYPGTKTPPAC